eukprot:7206776-Lingulodinium_polyedra.AAC.1
MQPQPHRMRMAFTTSSAKTVLSTFKPPGPPCAVKTGTLVQAWAIVCHRNGTRVSDCFGPRL